LFGDVIRQLRKAKGLTLQQVADITGLSVAFISQVENEQANPTLSSLRKIAAVLGTSVFALLAQGELREAACTHVSLDRRIKMNAPGWNPTYELISAAYAGTKLQSFYLELEPGQETCSEPTPHGTWESEEWVLVTEGTVELLAGNERQEMTTGESVHFHCAVPHKYRNKGQSRAHLITVMCPPSF